MSLGGLVILQVEAVADILLVAGGVETPIQMGLVGMQPRVAVAALVLETELPQLVEYLKKAEMAGRVMAVPVALRLLE